ncbi:Crp/Fnr family transcriptional regulator [Flavobacterium sp. A45]|uniref:Crp/Fnr family transcriptional regulator n=1 Tax=Flavobacterium sp. A45 TaxID=1945862 RepID=UPI000984D463|nr:Crp/Fnr family transcriptional regulator [Flavobacterium sp. A45]OOG66795.1 hypothetical protein B0E44_14885 [Flavobacterium sp. A45]
MQETLKEHIGKVIQISHEEYLDIESYFTRVFYKKGKYLVEAGNTAPFEFYILRGLVVSWHMNEVGKNSIIQFAMEGDWISDIQAFNTGSSSFIDIKCHEDTELFFISYADKEKLCSISKKMEYFFRKKSIANSLLLQKRILTFMCPDKKARFDQFLLHYPKIQLRAPAKLITTYLGITRKTLSQM